jgi:AcrR family transcriptional regulator
MVAEGQRKRRYKSLVRERRAGDTRSRILESAKQLLQKAGYAGMTIEAVADRAGVSVPTVYAVFKSKTGIVSEILHAARFGPAYEELVRRALSIGDPEQRLRIGAQIARHVHEAQSATLGLLGGAGVLAPELARLARLGERQRYERQEPTIKLAHESGRLRPGLSYERARDIFWMYTGRDIYRMLVIERGWSPQAYEDWLADTLAEVLLDGKKTRMPLQG